MTVNVHLLNEIAAKDRRIAKLKRRIKALKQPVSGGVSTSEEAIDEQPNGLISELLHFGEKAKRASAKKGAAAITQLYWVCIYAPKHGIEFVDYEATSPEAAVRMAKKGTQEAGDDPRDYNYLAATKREEVYPELERLIERLAKAKAKK